MSFTQRKDRDGAVVVGVDGQLIVGNRQELKQLMLDALEQGARRFVIDFTRTGYDAYPVVRGESVVGLLCLKDVLPLTREQWESTSVQAAMRPLADDIVTDPDAALLLAIRKMAQAGHPRLLVMREGGLLGLLTMAEVMRRLKTWEELTRVRP